jgi:hypothetical protein
VGDTRLRLHGIDTPELRQTCEDSSGEAWACGRRAASELAVAVAGGEVHCISRERDRYQRLVATCWAARTGCRAITRCAWLGCRVSALFGGLCERRESLALSYTRNVGREV